MNEDKLAKLDEIQDFFNRVDRPPVESIGVKDFIGWCNNPCKNISENSPHSDLAYKLGKTVLELNELNKIELNKLNENKLKEMESALKEDRWDEWCKDNSIKASADDAVFYLVLKYRTDDQRHYHFYFDKDAVAELDAFDPFTEDENGKEVLDQQWHVLISLLAYLDVAHALSSDQHEYHCLYPYLSSYDRGDLNKMKLKLKSTLSLEAMPEIGRTVNYHSEAMMAWIKDALVRREGK